MDDWDWPKRDASYDDLYRNDRFSADEKKRAAERNRQRKIIRGQDLTDEEIKTRGGELLKKIITVLPKHHGDKWAVVFDKGVQKIRIKLALHPNSVVDFVVNAFLVKGWKAKHVYKDNANPVDYLELQMPEDWLKRVLCIGRYNPDKKQEETKSDRLPGTPIWEQ